MKLVIEMSDTGRAGYASVHAAGCRDCKDPESMGEVTSTEDIAAAVYRTTGWDDPADFTVAPCVKP